jgi:hypothetical protein
MCNAPRELFGNGVNSGFLLHAKSPLRCHFVGHLLAQVL